VNFITLWLTYNFVQADCWLLVCFLSQIFFVKHSTRGSAPFCYHLKTVLFSELNTATEYYISITANYNSTISSQETQRLATTLALPPLEPLTFNNVTDWSVLARWLPREERPRPIRYMVTFSTRNEPPVTIEHVGETYLM